MSRRAQVGKDRDLNGRGLRSGKPGNEEKIELSGARIPGRFRTGLRSRGERCGTIVKVHSNTVKTRRRLRCSSGSWAELPEHG